MTATPPPTDAHPARPPTPAPRWTAWTGPAHPYRDRRLARHILATIDAHGPGAVLVVIPQSLRRERVVESLLAERPGGLFLPAIVPLDGLTASLAEGLGSTLDLLSPAARRVLLGELVSGLALAGDLRELAPGRELPGVVQRLDHFFQALGRQKIETPDLLRTLVTRYRGGHRIALDDEVHRLLVAYRARVPAEIPAGAGDPARVTLLEVQRALCADPDRLRRLLPGVRLVVVDGFTELTPRQADLADALAVATGEGLLVLDDLLGARDTDENSGTEDLRPRPRPSAVPAGSAMAHAPREPIPAPLDAVADIALALAADDLEQLPATRLPVDPARLTLSDPPTPRAEVQALARHLEDRHRAGELDQVAVAFAGLERYLPLVREVFVRQGIPFQARAGIPLASAPPVATALALLDTVSARCPRSMLVGLLRSPYLCIPETSPGILHQADRWARAAGVVGGDPDLGASWIDPLTRLAAEFDAQHDPHRPHRPGAAEADEVRELRETLATTFTLLAPLAVLVDTADDAETFVTTLRQALERLGVWTRSEESLRDPTLRAAGRRDLEARRALDRLLDDLTRTLGTFADPPRLVLSGWIVRVRALVAEETLAPMEEVRGGVPVVALTDLRHLAATTVYVGGLTEGHFPRRRSRDLLYPETHDLDRDFLVHPDPSREDTHALLAALVERSTVHLSYPRRIAEEDQLPAALVERLTAVLEIPSPPPPVATPPVGDRLAGELRDARGEPDRVAAAMATGLADPALAAATARVLPGLRVAVARATEAASVHTGFMGGTTVAVHLRPRGPGGTHVFSATELEAYASCSFRYLMEKVVGLGVLEEVDEEISPLARGRLVHEILHRFHEDEHRGRVDLHADDAPRHLARIADAVLADLPAGTLLADAARAALVAGLDPGDDRRPGSLAAYLDTERARRADGWRPIALEWPFGLGRGSLPLTLSAEGGDVCVRGKVDRVDAREGGRMVIDYKTGSIPSGREIREGQRFQLPIYLAAYRAAHPEEPEPSWSAAFYAVPPRGEDPVRAFHRSPLSPREAAAEREDLTRRLGELTRAMSGGSFPLTLLGGSKAPCGLHRRGAAAGSGCPYRRVCRIDGTRLAVRRQALAASTALVYGLEGSSRGDETADEEGS